MADHMAGHMRIGGRIKEEDIGAFCGVVTDVAGEFTPEDLRDALTNWDDTFEFEDGWTAESGILHIYSVDATDGKFERLERFCVSHGIPFIRESESKCNYPAERVHFRPDCAELWKELQDDHRIESDGVLSVVTAADDETQMLDADAVAKHIKPILEYFDQQEKAGKILLEGEAKSHTISETVVYVPFDARVGAKCIEAMIEPKFADLPSMMIVK